MWSLKFIHAFFLFYSHLNIKYKLNKTKYFDIWSFSQIFGIKVDILMYNPRERERVKKENCWGTRLVLFLNWYLLLFWQPDRTWTVWVSSALMRYNLAVWLSRSSARPFIISRPGLKSAQLEVWREGRLGMAACWRWWRACQAARLCQCEERKWMARELPTTTTGPAQRDRPTYVFGNAEQADFTCKNNIWNWIAFL